MQHKKQKGLKDSPSLYKGNQPNTIHLSQIRLNLTENSHLQIIGRSSHYFTKILKIKSTLEVRFSF